GGVPRRRLQERALRELQPEPGAVRGLLPAPRRVREVRHRQLALRVLRFLAGRDQRVARRLRELPQLRDQPRHAALPGRHRRPRHGARLPQPEAERDVDGQLRRRRQAHLSREALRAQRLLARGEVVALAGSLAQSALWGYGEKPWRLALVMAFKIVLFGSVLHWVDPLPGKSWWEHVYFSAITYLTVGYGDLAPHSPLAQLLSVICAAAGIATFGMLIASVTKKVMYR